MNSRFLNLTLALTLTVLPSLGAAAPQGTARTELAVASAPTLTSPAEGEVIASFGPTLSWQSPAGVTQYHLQVIPARNDGPGIDIHGGTAQTSFSIPAPPAWYGLLPDLGYTWRLRLSDASTFVALDDPSWSTWSEGHFRTPPVSSQSIRPVFPQNTETVTTLTPNLQWTNTRPDVFYYEVQVSKDFNFNTNPATATAMVYWELIHGGVAQPNNSYQIPAAFPLENNASYYWRVRPRVQGDGTPVAWSEAANFVTRQGASPSPSPSPSVSPSPSPSPSTSPSPSPSPSPSGNPAYTGERLAFVSMKDGAAEIWAIRPDGTGLVNLSQDRGTDDKPVWSKDGTKLAYVSDRDGNRELYTMNANGSNQTRVTNNSALDDDPSWSPDGTKLAFISRRDASLGQQIYRVNADGSGVTRITNNTAAHWQPVWSPDGTKLMYGSSRAGDLEIFTAGADGAGEKALVGNPAQEFGHNWSPDGTKIAFHSTRDGRFEVYSMNADGTNQKALSNHPANDTNPVWSPDGKKIAFVSDREGNLDVFVMNADGTGQVNLSANSAEDCSPLYCMPAWSPDSNWVAFVSKRDGNMQKVYVVRADGTGLKRVNTGDGDEKFPVWAPK